MKVKTVTTEPYPTNGWYAENCVGIYDAPKETHTLYMGGQTVLRIEQSGEGRPFVLSYLPLIYLPADLEKAKDLAAEIYDQIYGAQNCDTGLKVNEIFRSICPLIEGYVEAEESDGEVSSHPDAHIGT